MKITINRFGGISPLTPPRYLQDSQAQTAYNCLTGQGPIQPLKRTTELMVLPKPGTAQSIYRFGQTETNPTRFWFHWDSVVDVVRGFVNGDTTERTFFTGVGIPQATDNELMTSSDGRYPNRSRMLGVPQPTQPLTVAAEGTPDENATTETRVYTYTIVNSWGEESQPYTTVTAGMELDVLSGQHVRVSFPPVPSGAYEPRYRRLYRSVNGVYLLVYATIDGGTVTADIPASADVVLDYNDPDELGEVLPSLTWQTPPPNLKGLTGLPGGVLAGFAGIDVYFSEPYRPFAWPRQYNQTVGYDIVGLGNIDTTLVVLTTGKPYFIQGVSPDAMAVVEADLSQACVSKQSIVSMDGVVIYASPDGLIALAPGGSTNITEQSFGKHQWQSLFKPESIHAYAYEGKYVAFYDTGNAKGGFVFDRRAGTFTLHGIYAEGGYSDLKTDTLYLTVNNRLHTWDTGEPLTFTWKSKKFTFPDLISFTCYRVNAEAYPVQVRFFRDGVLYFTHEVRDRNILRLPAGYAHDFEVEVVSAFEVFNIQIARSPREIADG
jgi:hypothetical protein